MNAVIYAPVSTGDVVSIPGGSERAPTKARAVASNALDAAVYKYIQAVRALGQQSVSVSTIAAALNRSRSDAMAALTRLEAKGVTKR